MVDLLDVDRDGDPDIVVGQRSGFRGLVFYLNHGDATFDPPLNAVSTGYMSSFTSADFDGDGALDLAVPIEFPVGVEILRNVGGGKFTESLTLSWPQKTFSPPVFITPGDFTGDGLGDVIVGPYDDLPARLYAGLGNFSFATPVKLSGVSFSYMLCFLFSGDLPPSCLESADSNNDGRIDCTDPVLTLGYLFLGTDPPADPGPPGLGEVCAA